MKLVKLKLARQDILVIAAVVTVLSILWIAFGFYYYLSPAMNLQPEVPLALFGGGVTATSDGGQRHCANPLSYWAQHPERLPSQVVIGEQVYTREQLSIILASESDDVTLLLLKQLVAAFLNQMEAGDVPALEGALYQAYQWLAAFPPGSQVPEGEVEKGASLRSALEAFNSGRAGMDACPAEASSPTPTVMAITAVPTATGTLTVTATLPPSPTFTPAPTEPEPTDTPYIPPPTATTRPYYSPTPEPPTKEPPTAEPSDTPFVPTFTLEPTEAPTNTAEPPTPTLAPTELPTPSPAPTEIPTPTLAPLRQTRFESL